MSKWNIALWVVLVPALINCDSEVQLQTKCLHGPESNENLKKSVESMKTCIIANLENLRQMISENTCRPHSDASIFHCYVFAYNSISNCKPLDEHRFPKDVLKLMTNYTEFLCKHAFAYKVSIRSETAVCFSSIEFATNCYEKFRFFDPERLVLQEEMCEDMRQVSQCLLDYADTFCTEDEIFKTMVNNTFRFDVPPCRSLATSLNFGILSTAFLVLTTSLLRK